MQDIIVYISLDTASKEKETLLPLILSFEGAFAYKEYNKAEDVAKDFTTASSPTLAAAQKLFDQIKVENCPGRTKKVAIFGLASDSTAKAVTDALDTLRETNDDWYFLIPAGATDTIITALSTWASATVLTLAQLESGMVESEKLLIAQTKTKSLINTAMKANKQTVICYNHDVHPRGVGRPRRPQLSDQRHLEVEGAVRHPRHRREGHGPRRPAGRPLQHVYRTPRARVYERGHLHGRRLH